MFFLKIVKSADYACIFDIKINLSLLLLLLLLILLSVLLFFVALIVFIIAYR